MPKSSFSLEGETALVTGGGTGLGEAIARSLIDAGSTVAIVGRRSNVLHEASSRIGAHAFVSDLTVLESLPALVECIERKLGPISILVNNAGIHLKSSALETTDVQFGAVVQTHLNAGFALARTVARGMLDRRRGSIVFLGSMAAMFGIPSVSAYTAAKGGVTALVAALASEWSPHGVRVNSVSPGWIDAGMARATLAKDPARQAKIIGRTPMGRLGEPQDVGNAVVYLCSAAGKFVTGTNLVVDGGASGGF